jgi:hypothetical protein
VNSSTDNGGRESHDLVSHLWNFKILIGDGFNISPTSKLIQVNGGESANGI